MEVFAEPTALEVFDEVDKEPNKGGVVPSLGLALPACPAL